MNEFEQLQEKVLSLQNVILAKHPQLPTLLSEILTAISKHPENVILLAPEEISLIVSGIENQTGNFLAASITKPAAAKSSLAKIKANAAAALGM